MPDKEVLEDIEEMIEELLLHMNANVKNSYKLKDIYRVAIP